MQGVGAELAEVHAVTGVVLVDFPLVRLRRVKGETEEFKDQKEPLIEDYLKRIKTADEIRLLARDSGRGIP